MQVDLPPEYTQCMAKETCSLPEQKLHNYLIRLPEGRILTKDILRWHIHVPSVSAEPCGYFRLVDPLFEGIPCLVVTDVSY